MEQENFFSRLKKLRETCGWSQKDLSMKMGVSSNTVQSWEKDTYPKGDALIRLSDFLQCSIDWLLTGKGEVNGKSSQIPQSKNINTNDNNLTVLQHIDLIKQFKDRETAKSANMDLLNIEKLNRSAFREVASYIKGISNGLKMADHNHTTHTDNPGGGREDADVIITKDDVRRAS